MQMPTRVSAANTQTPRSSSLLISLPVYNEVIFPFHEARYCRRRSLTCATFYEYTVDRILDVPELILRQQFLLLVLGQKLNCREFLFESSQTVSAGAGPMGHRGDGRGSNNAALYSKPTVHASGRWRHFQRQIKRRQSSRDFFI